MDWQWAVTLRTARRGLGGALFPVPNVTTHPSKANVKINVSGFI